MLPSHIVISYVAYALLAGKENNVNFYPFLFSATILDLDHIIAYKLNKDKGVISIGALRRTRMHELYGLIVFSIIVLIIWFFNKTLAQILGLGMLMHYSIDFVFGESRPFYPYSNEKIQIFFTNNKKLKIIIEIFLFFIFIALVIWRAYKN